MTDEQQQETIEPVQEVVTEAPAEMATESAPVESEDTSAPEPEKSGVQKRIDQLTWKAREAERRAQYAEQQLAQRQEPPKMEAEPQLDDFGDYDQYMRALGRWEAKQEIQSWQAQQEQERRQAEAYTRRQTYDQKAASFAVDHADFDEVTGNPYLPITEDMATVIQSSDHGPEVLYHLGQNPQEAAQLSQLPPYMQAAALGRLEAKLTAPKPTQVSGAPPPVSPVGGGDGVVKDLYSGDMTTEEWIAKRNSQTQR